MKIILATCVAIIVLSIVDASLFNGYYAPRIIAMVNYLLRSFA